MTSDNISSLFAPDPNKPAGAVLGQGIVQAWNPDTGENEIQFAGGTLANIPSLTSEAVNLAADDVVALAVSGDRMLVLGKVTTPGDPGTVPTWPTDITALDDSVTTLNTVTIPAVQADVTTAQTTADAAQADASTALAKFPITETEITDGAISTPKLAANSVAADKIQADAIDGKTITGAVIQTSATGTRVVLGSDVLPEWKDQILMYTGHADSPDPAEFQVSGHTEQAQLLISGPPLSAFAAPVPTINLYSDQASDTMGVDLIGYQIQVQDPDGGNVTMTGGSVAADGAITSAGILVLTEATVQPYYYAYLSSSQAIPTAGSAAKVTGWVTDGSPSSSGITHSSGNFTVPTTGRYRLRAQAWWASVASPTGVRTAQWVKSPSTLLSSHTVPGNSATVPMPVYTEKTVRLTAGDQVFLQVIQGQANGHNLIGSTPDITYAQIEWVGP